MTQGIVLPVDLVNAILGYLGTRPYQETYQLIQTIQQLAGQQIEAQKPAEESVEA